MAQRLLTKIGFFEHQEGTGAVRVFKFRPNPSEEAGFGKLFGIAECSSKRGEAALETLEDVLSEYYSPAVRGRWTQGRTISTESLFEELLHETNEEWNRRQIIPPDEKIQIIVGLQKDNMLFIAGHGSLRALLFRERDGGHLQHFDLLRLKEGSGGDEGGIFSHVISGELLPGDSVVLLSEKFLDKLTLREVEKALMLNPNGGSAILEEELVAQEVKMPIAALILRRQAEEEAQGRLRQAVSPHSSVASLRQTERSTEKVLAPQTLPSVKEFLSSLTLGGGGKKQKGGFIKRAERPFTGRIKKIFRNILKIIIFILGSVAAGLSFIFTMATNWRGKRTKVIGELKMSSKLTAENTISSFNVLPRKSKTILLSGLVLLFIFTQSAMLITRRNYRAERELAWKSLYDDISAKRDEIESSLVYGDEPHARTLFADAERSMNALENDSKKHEEDIKKLRELLDQTSMRLYHVAVIENTNEIANIDENINAASLLLGKDGLLAAGAGGAVKIKLAEKATETLSAPPLSSPGVIFSISENGSVLALAGASAAALSDGAWEVSALNKTKMISADEAAIYGEGLYILDSQGDNIWRYRKSEEGYGSETGWLRESQELQSVASFAIDSSMYMLERNGIIRRFYRGREEEFRADPVEPAFGGLGAKTASAKDMPEPAKGKIRTSSGSNFIYVLDPSGKRIIVWNKEGRLVAQYRSSRFDDLKDLAFDEKKKEIYVLNKNQVLVFLAVHLSKK